MVTQTLIRKVIPFEVKEISPRVLEFVGSTEDKDRMGDIIMASGWQLKNYKKNPVFLWAHRYDDPPIGKAVKVWTEDDRLKFHIQFAEKDEYEFADTILKLYKGGYLRATSVGFMPLDSEPIEQKDDDELFFHQPTRYLKQDLLELSGCPVPANPNALAEAKAKGLINKKQLQSMEEMESEYREASAAETEAKSAISYQSAHPDGTPKAGEDEEWEAGQEVAEAEVDDLKVMCTIVQGDPDLKTSYKLPHHRASGKHAVVWKGVAAAGAVLMGARGGIDATEAEKNGAKAHLAKHYEEFDKTPPWESEKGISQEQIADELDYLLTAVSAEGLNEANIKAAWALVDEIMRLSGSDMPVDIAQKVGAVLNKVNRDRLEKIKSLAQEVLDSAEKPEEPEPEKDQLISEEREIQLIAETVKRILSKAQGKIIRR